MRHADWPQRLAAHIESAGSQEFEYGTADCCQFVAGAVAAMTGADPRELFPPYASEAEAQAILDTHGGLAGLLSHAFGEPVHKSSMGRGDVSLVAGPDGALCAAVWTGTRAVGRGPVGAVEGAYDAVDMAWRVE